MQMSAARHSSRTSMELTDALASLGIGSGVLAVATCTGGVSDGCICDESVNAASVIDSGSSEAVLVSVAVTNAGAAISELSTAAPPIAVACRASASSASAVRDGGWSTIGAAPVFSVPAEAKPASQATTQPARTVVKAAAAVASRRGSMIAASKDSI